MFSELIYDRTYSDVDEIINDPTSENTKGACNYDDLNRLERCFYYLKVALGDLGYDTTGIEVNLRKKSYSELEYDTYDDIGDITYEELMFDGNIGAWTVENLPLYADSKRWYNNITIINDLLNSNLLEEDYTVIYYDFKNWYFDYVYLNAIERFLFYSYGLTNCKTEVPYCGSFFCGGENLY